MAEWVLDTETKGTGIVPFMLMGIMHAIDMSAVVGGTQNMTLALERCVQACAAATITDRPFPTPSGDDD